MTVAEVVVVTIGLLLFCDVISDGSVVWEVVTLVNIALPDVLPDVILVDVISSCDIISDVASVAVVTSDSRADTSTRNVIAYDSICPWP